MKLWLLEQSDNTGYDTYDAAVVAAETEEEARDISPTPRDNDWVEEQYDWANTREGVKVTFLGEACPGMKKGLILASFNAG